MNNEFDLSNELQLFKESAEKGYNLANKSLSSLEEYLKEAHYKVKLCSAKDRPSSDWKLAVASQV